MEYQSREPLLPATPQRTVLTLSPTGGTSDYSRLLPSKTSRESEKVTNPATAATGVFQRSTDVTTLTPERVQQQLQSPPRRRMSAFTSPNRRVPTKVILAEGELNFITRNIESNGNDTNFDDVYDDSFLSYPQHLRAGMNQAFMNNHSFERTPVVSLDYISPATTPAKSDADNASPILDSITSYLDNIAENVSTSAVVVPTIVVPLNPPTTEPYPSMSTHNMPHDHPLLHNNMFGTYVTPLHLLEQQQEHLLLQQEQELLQRQLQSEFYDEQRRQYNGAACSDIIQSDEELAMQRDLQNEFQNEERLHLMEQLLTQNRCESLTNDSFRSCHPTQTSPEQSGEHTHFESLKFDPPEVTREMNQFLPDKSPVQTKSMSTENVNANDGSLLNFLGNNAQEELLVTKKNVDHTQSIQNEKQQDESKVIQQQVVQRMMSVADENNKSQLNIVRRNHKAALRAARGETSTPRISNSSSASDTDAFSDKEDDNKKWSAETYDSLKSSMHRAMGKLTTLATHIANTSDDFVPEAMNTSNESSSSSADHDATNSGLDIKDLEGELRGSKASEFQHNLEYAHRRRDSTASFDTLGAPKPATINQPSLPPSNVQKPVPLKGNPKLPQPSRKRVAALNKSTGPSIFLQPSDSRTRSVTPIVRMRNREAELQAPVLEEVEPTSSKTDVQEMNEKERKVKIKTTKRVTDKYDKDKLQLDVRTERSRIKSSSKQQYQQNKKMNQRKRKNIKEPSFLSLGGSRYQIPNGIPTCKGDIIELLERFMSVRCGNLDDTYDGDEEVDDESLESNELSFYSDDDESASYSEASTIPKEDTRLTKSPQNRSLNRSIKEAQKHSINVDVNDKQFIRQFIAKATTDGIVLFSHEKNQLQALKRPVKNLLFLHRGEKSHSGSFIGPKLLWKEVNGDKKREVDLFAIRSLDKATALELENYPYAMPGRSLFLRISKDIDYVFEARDETEALQFVHGMRWLIARLAFNLIIGNVSVSCELLDVNGASNIDDRYGMFPSTVKEESQWTAAMNEVTTHLVQEVSRSLK